MAHLTVSVEYGVHSLLWLADANGQALSVRDLADLQSISPSFLAKILPKLEKAGIVSAQEGVRGGYLLARPPESVTILQIVDAVEGRKPLFDCQEIRGRCAVFGESPPDWAIAGTCSVHAVMLRAEKAMRDSLDSQTLADIGKAFGRKAPPEFAAGIRDWLAGRVESRTGKSRPSTGAANGEEV